MKKLFIFISIFIYNQASFAQKLFGDACIGNWKGTMYIYNKGQLKDTLTVKLTVKKTDMPNEWTWKTEYISTKMPMVKNYKLRLKDATNNTGGFGIFWVNFPGK